MVWLGFTSVKNAKTRYGYDTAVVFYSSKSKNRYDWDFNLFKILKQSKAGVLYCGKAKIRHSWGMAGNFSCSKSKNKIRLGVSAGNRYFGELFVSTSEIFNLIGRLGTRPSFYEV